MLRQLKQLKERITPTDIVMWLIGGTLFGLALWGSIATLRAGLYTGRHWIDFVIFGLAQGSIYALIATGYTMVYGVLKMINFAHGEVFMSGSAGENRWMACRGIIRFGNARPFDLRP